MIEKLAEFAHKQWCGWMTYLFGKCTSNDDGTMTIPAQSVQRWKRQMSTDYADLPENEKESDRREALEMISTFVVTCRPGPRQTATVSDITDSTHNPQSLKCPR